MAQHAGETQPHGEGSNPSTGSRFLREIEFEELDDITGGVLSDFARGLQPDGGGGRAHT